MLNDLRSLMRMSFSRSALVGGMLGLAVCLAGCASKNPLMDEPAAPSLATATATAPAPGKSETVKADSVTTTEPTRLQRFRNFFSPYRIEIQQGNFVSREMLAQLNERMQRKEAITPEQVKFALGTPLLTDIFHADRWDYVFRLKKPSGEVISSRVTVFFQNNQLARIEGGMLPTEQEYLAMIAGRVAGDKPASSAAPNK